MINQKEDSKIGYPFVPIPKFFCTMDFFRMPQTLVFVLWIFNRITFEKRSILFNKIYIDLEIGEFIFGRKTCSEELGLSEQSVRTIMKSLLKRGILKKNAHKSTNRFSVYSILWSQFIKKTNQHLTNKSARDNLKENKTRESDSTSNFSDISNSDNFSSKIVLEGEAKKLFTSLSNEEQNAIFALLKKREKKNPISNLQGWIIQCIKEKWHKEKEFELTFDKEIKSNDFVINQSLARSLLPTLEQIATIRVCIRSDFLEIGKVEHTPWQLFFYESAHVFRMLLEASIKKMNLIPSEIFKNHR